MLNPFVVLIVLDGWGLAAPFPGNAISAASTPNFDRLWASYPHTQLTASGNSVGLPRGEAGNTETGHLNLGAGRIVFQDLMRIDMAIANGTFFDNKTFLAAIDHAKKNQSNLHLMGLVGGGGVHSSASHLYALLELCQKQSFNRVFIHVFTDGRDSPPSGAETYISQLESAMGKVGFGTISSVMGRYWGMDRDYRWDRTEVSYIALTQGKGMHVRSPREAIESAYDKGITDEFITPAIIVDKNGPVGLICENDAVIFFNFRVDRPRQLSKAFVLDNFEREAQKEWGFDPYAVKYHKTHLAKIPDARPFSRGPKVKNLLFVTMTEYAKELNSYIKVAYPPEIVGLTLSGVVASRDLRQLKLAESEKERFVTFYFNGQRETVFQGEHIQIIPSLDVPTYDQSPQMSAGAITNSLLKALSSNSQRYSLILVNFANADMVGHTGNFQSTVEACGVVDECVGKVCTKATSLGGVVAITGDHGNAEQMLTADGKPHTEHTINPVPFIVVGKEYAGNSAALESGKLADVAPTILDLIGIKKPSEMTGRSLLNN